MADFAAVMTWVVNTMKIPFTIYGVTLSFWNIFIFSLIGGIVAPLVGSLIVGSLNSPSAPKNAGGKGGKKHG